MKTFIKELKWGSFILLRNDLISNVASNYGEWSEAEVDLYKVILNADSNVVEVGSNIGLHAVPLSSICHRGKVFCFEPQRHIFNILCGNIAINNRLNIYAFNKAIGDKYEVVALPEADYTRQWNYGSFSVDKGYSTEENFGSTDNTCDTEIVKLDSVKILQKVKVDFIKIDVEGFEPNVLKGAESMIKKDRPFIFMETLNEKPVNECIDLLHKLNYQGFAFASARERKNNFFSFVKTDAIKKYDCNMLFIPAENTEATSKHGKVLKRISEFKDIYDSAIFSDYNP